MNDNKLIARIKKVKTVEDLQELNIGNVIVDVSSRGGKLGFRSGDVANAADVPISYLPVSGYGVFCNYLGGGLRGSIVNSGFSPAVKGAKAKLLNELAAACKKAYLSTEDDSGLCDETYPDGDTNWESLGTKKCREAGLVSAY